ncbi:MAG TPA: hypothetical protein VK393_04965 [Nocardioidaceae bacterium]|jgi:hypothetical protein|nr:hypothetical protein [Nocardioidaceae bacterium]
MNMALEGLVAGTVGAAVMTVAEKVEQQITGRPSSFVPAVTLGRLTGIADVHAQRSKPLNLGMHFGQAALLGVVRATMAEGGLRGPWASVMFTLLRFSNDQTLENYTGAGAPPWTWPRNELVIDLVHKSVYGFTTGVVADRLAARRGPGRGMLHASLRPGRHADVGPPPQRPTSVKS